MRKGGAKLLIRNLREQAEREQLRIACVSGSFIKERYIKCPHTEKQCQWRMSNNHREGYEYLNNSCYLSGSFELKCPD